MVELSKTNYGLQWLTDYAWISLFNAFQLALNFFKGISGKSALNLSSLINNWKPNDEWRSASEVQCFADLQATVRLRSTKVRIPAPDFTYCTVLTVTYSTVYPFTCPWYYGIYTNAWNACIHSTGKRKAFFFLPLFATRLSLCKHQTVQYVQYSVVYSTYSI